MDDKILSLYARGMTTCDIADSFKEMYNADISPTLISKVTNAVIEEVSRWQNEPLDNIYPIVYFCDAKWGVVIIIYIHTTNKEFSFYELTYYFASLRIVFATFKMDDR